LVKQLELLDPDVIVIAGVDLQWDDTLVKVLPKNTYWNWTEWRGRHRLFIQTWHPQARNGKDKLSLARIEEAIKEVKLNGSWRH